MSVGHLLVSSLLAQAAPPSPGPVGILPPIPTLPSGLPVPPERTGQIVAAALAVLLDLLGLAAVGVASLFDRHRRHSSPPYKP